MEMMEVAMVYNVFLDVYIKPSQLHLHMMPPKTPINVWKGGDRESSLRLFM